ncbi:MAG: sulfite exporter TauE/SafE family protein [Candidatus Viridilinea halotolerans]|uniref:Probable membrane transporter protein n=1 Tax=Candidatus Viridilinea halotolerans TaxID=2491704 RepID=A0A426U384_9CHLR|nr:MAG: sulfite exporter TauE/SafE family protein [Candidatus Viridilinea halotolerans]
MPLDFAQIVLLFMAALVAGMLNAVAGGGSFISFPALLFTGMPAILANATNAAALWPGAAASVGAYREELKSQRHELKLFSGLSLLGGLLGALLLLRIRESVFEQLIPYLMLLATVVFIASPMITRLARKKHNDQTQVGPLRRAGLMVIYLAVAIYGGFFGAGLGILTLAVLALLGGENIHEMNALKTLQAALINGVAVFTFIIAGIIQWPQMFVMTIGAIIGGYSGAAVARRMPTRVVRGIVIVISVVLTVYFFVR